MLISISSLIMEGCSFERTDHARRYDEEEEEEIVEVTETSETFKATPTPTPAPTIDPSSDPEKVRNTIAPAAASRTDIYSIADTDWARQNAPLFSVSTPEQFAGVVKYVNEESNGESVDIYLMADLDLDQYSWLPMNDFSGNIHGQGHTISNIHLTEPQQGHNGIIGVNGGPIGIFDLRVENAEVIGGRYAAILVGEGYMAGFENVYVSGSVTSDGEFTGALLGRCSPGMVYDSCSMDVMVNGQQAQFHSFTEENESHADDYANEIYTLTLAPDNTVSRSNENYTARNLTWRIIYNGEIVLERNAENELSYRYFNDSPGTYTIYLTEYNSQFGGYVRVSNTVEYTIP